MFSYYYTYNYRDDHMIALFSLDQSRLRSEDVLCCFIIIIKNKSFANFIYQRQRERESRGPMGEEGEKQTVPPPPPSAAAEETRAPELQSDPPTPFDPSRSKLPFSSLLLYCLVFRVFCFVYLLSTWLINSPWDSDWYY